MSHPVTMYSSWLYLPSQDPISHLPSSYNVFSGLLSSSQDSADRPTQSQCIPYECSDNLTIQLSGPTSTSQSADDDEGLRGTGWGEGGPVYLET